MGAYGEAARLLSVRLGTYNGSFRIWWVDLLDLETVV